VDAGTLSGPAPPDCAPGVAVTTCNAPAGGLGRRVRTEATGPARAAQEFPPASSVGWCQQILTAERDEITISSRQRDWSVVADELVSDDTSACPVAGRPVRRRAVPGRRLVVARQLAADRERGYRTRPSSTRPRRRRPRKEPSSQRWQRKFDRQLLRAARLLYRRPSPSNRHRDRERCRPIARRRA
jgi:hypothetical protein